MPIATPQGTLDFKSVDKVTFVGASSNTVIDTTTGSLGVGVDGNGPTSNLHVVGNAFVSSDLTVSGNVNMLHTSNTASIKLNSNVVTEFPRSKKLIKYPSVALTSAAGESSGYQGYYVTESSNSTNTNRHSWKAFDMTFATDTSDNGWANGIDDYSGSGNTYQGSSNLGTGAVDGEWIKLQLPHKIRLEYMKIWLKDNDPTRIPDSWILYGSDDNTNWTQLFSKTGQGAVHENIYNVNANSMYNYLGVVVTKISGQPNYFRIMELEFWGVPEYDSEAHGTDVVVKSVPNIPNTDWLEVYYDGQDYSTMPATVTDKSGNNRTGTPTGGVGFDTEYKAFTFDGANDYISSTTTATLSNHTASMWIKFDSPAAWEAVYSIKPASGFDRNNFILYLNSTYFRLESSGNVGPYYDLAYNFVIGKWVHLTLVFRGSGLGDCEMYIDNVRLYPDGGQRSLTDDITITGTNTIYVGSDPSGTTQYYLDGSIANFRIFNRALTTDEIYQLYAYQKEYFGHGDLSMTLKAGRLGIGTSEPRAALDVRGNILGGSPAAFSVAYNPTSLSGNQTIIWNLVYHNIGGGYNSSSGLFTAPVSGYYHFTVWGMTSGSTSGVIEFQFRKNGSTVQQRPYGQAGSNYGNATGTIIEYLSVGDTMSIFLTNSATMYASSAQSYNGFSGFYLSN